jgi:phosphohistidine swiveling domain-containing protein
VKFSTKAETLESLAGKLSSGTVLPLFRFSVAAWRSDREAVLASVQDGGWLSKRLIVRSSALSEDGDSASQAGRFLSVADIQGEPAVVAAVERVIESYSDRPQEGDQVFLQQMLTGVRAAGVAFSVEPSSGAPYFVVNYDTQSGSTSSVTKGDGTTLKVCYVCRAEPGAPEETVARVVALVRELERLFQNDRLDVEFAVAGDGTLYCLQVRPLAGARAAQVPPEHHARALRNIHRALTERSSPHPYLHGSRSILGVMPDWNPAEIIGVRPSPLALSLYKDLVTDSIWAYQRDNYGYRNLRSFPLMASLSGLPYIDVRVDFNSFVPKDVSSEIAEKLVNFYLDRLAEMPSHHDKVEFEIVFSCYTLDLPRRLAPLRDHGFSAEECGALEESLRKLTNNIIHGKTGLWLKDLDRISHLERAHRAVLDSSLDPVSKVYWLLEDCKRYGTLPFAGLARAAFIAVQLLKSLVAVGILSESDYDAFMSSLDTVSSRMARDFKRLTKPAFLEIYGHLRPGTYDLLSSRYDENPDKYFDWSSQGGEQPAPRPPFALSLDQLRAAERELVEHRLDHDVLGLFEFIRRAIEGREHAKFVFTRSLSDALSILGALGREHGLSLEDMSFTDIATIRTLYSGSGDVGDVLQESAAYGRNGHALTQSVILPPLLTDPSQVWNFEMPPSSPNFITLKRVTASTVRFEDDSDDLSQKIVFLQSADPGFDWVFSKNIAGFVTMYGGANSHMAIRAGELGIPAVIGAGEVLYGRWSSHNLVELDCSSRQVRLL